MKIYCKGYGLNCQECKKEKCIDFRGKAEQRKLVYPAVYKHFKYTEDGLLNNYMYATMGISKPLNDKEFKRNITIAMTDIIARHSETGKEVFVLICDDGFYHNEEIESEDMVLYKSMYDNRTYVRKLDMFLSEVDHNKYPDVKQKYIFELVRY